MNTRLHFFKRGDLIIKSKEKKLYEFLKNLPLSGKTARGQLHTIDEATRKIEKYFIQERIQKYGNKRK